MSEHRYIRPSQQLNAWYKGADSFPAAASCHQSEQQFTPFTKAWHGSPAPNWIFLTNPYTLLAYQKLRGALKTQSVVMEKNSI